MRGRLSAGGLGPVNCGIRLLRICHELCSKRLMLRAPNMVIIIGGAD